MGATSSMRYGHLLNRMGSGYMLELKDVLGIKELRDKGFWGSDQNIIRKFVLRSVSLSIDRDCS
jgi:hypothetical protein